MKILIADDSNEKVTRLLDIITEAGVGRDQVDVAYTIFDAKRALRDADYDLLVLDVLLPARAGDAPRYSGAIDLLTEIADRTTLRKPRQIIGLTAYDDAVREAGPAFLNRTWIVIKFSFETDEWKEQLKACIAYIRASIGQTPLRTYRTDLCIVAALPNPEFDAVMRLPWNWGVSEPLDDNTFVRRGSFQSAGACYTVTAAHATKMGMVSAALLASKIIGHEVPRFLVMPGICAGIEGKANLGDVVIADPSWDWQSGKHFVELEQHGFAMAPDPIGLASFIRARFEQIRLNRDIWSTIRGGWPDPPDTELKLRLGPMASGSSVLADKEVVDTIVRQNRNLVAVEMEAFGVVCASSLASHPRPTAFICKSICDFADELKNDRWRSYAAYTSAQTLRVFFEQHMSEIYQLAGTG